MLEVIFRGNAGISFDTCINTYLKTRKNTFSIDQISSPHMLLICEISAINLKI